MLKNTILAMLIAVLAFGIYSGLTTGGAAEAQRGAALGRPAMVLRHNVLFRFKEETSAADIRKVEQAFCALPSRIPAIYDFEWGTDVGVEGLSDGFTHCFFVTFRDEAGRAEYLPHPEHKAFGQVLGPHLDKVIVIDYWTKP